MSDSIFSKSKELEPSVPKPEWKKVEDGHYSEDHIINAYLSGRETAIDEISDALTRQKMQFLTKGMEYADVLLQKLAEQYDISFEKVFLRQNNFKYIDVVIVLPGDIYFANKMSEIYEVSFEVEEQAEELELSFSFSYNLLEIDTTKMVRDGYFFSREP
jgi:hypothetical protein